MKKQYTINTLIISLSAFALVHVVAAAPDSIEYYLANAEEYVDKEIKLDVSHVSPTKFVSPVDGVAFLFVVTVDDRANRPGGTLIMMLPEDQKDKIVRKYGLNHERGRDRSMKAVLRTVSARPVQGGLERYILDYTGEMKALVGDKLEEAYRLSLGERGRAGRPGAPRR